jgi:drug/metabolite transporter (DMT)-like permease
MKKPDALSCGMMALTGALWGVHGPALKFAFAAGFTSPQLVLGECLVGAVVFGAVVLFQRVRPPTDRRFWATLVTAGLVGTGVTVFLFKAYQLGPVSIGATLLFLYVPFTQVLNAIIARRRPDPTQTVAALLVVVGAVLAADFLSTANVANLRGAPYAVLAALCFATFFVMTSRLGQSGTPALRSFVCCTASSGLLFVTGSIAGWTLVPSVPAPAAAVWLLLLGVFGQVIPVFAMVHFGPRTGSGLGSILTSTELPVAVVTSAVILHDPVGPLQVAGVALVLAGIALPHLRRSSVP